MQGRASLEHGAGAKAAGGHHGRVRDRAEAEVGRHRLGVQSVRAVRAVAGGVVDLEADLALGEDSLAHIKQVDHLVRGRGRVRVRVRVRVRLGLGPGLRLGLGL